LSNKYIAGSEAAGGNNVNGSRREREGRAPSTSSFNGTGAQPAANNGRGHSGYPGNFDFDEMIASLRELFAHDRQVASQAENKRCGICYLYYTPAELTYREEEGFYICSSCMRTLGKQNLPMIRRQQK
jgi:hypothetical protein